MEIINWMRAPAIGGYFLIHYGSYDNNLSEYFYETPLTTGAISARTGWLDYWNTEDTTIQADFHSSEGDQSKSFSNDGRVHNLTPEEKEIISSGDIDEIDGLVIRWVKSINEDGKITLNTKRGDVDFWCHRITVMSIGDHYTTTSYGKIKYGERTI